MKLVGFIVALLFIQKAHGGCPCTSGIGVINAQSILYSATGNTPVNTATATITCEDGYTINGSNPYVTTACDDTSANCWQDGLTCDSARTLDLAALRQMSKDAYKTQKWWVKKSPVLEMICIGITTGLCIFGSLLIKKVLIAGRERKERMDAIRARLEASGQEVPENLEELVDEYYGDYGGKGFADDFDFDIGLNFKKGGGGWQIQTAN